MEPLEDPKLPESSAKESAARRGFRSRRRIAGTLRPRFRLLGFKPGRRAPAAWSASRRQPFQAQDGLVNLCTLSAQIFQDCIQIHDILAVLWRPPIHSVRLRSGASDRSLENPHSNFPPFLS